MKKWKTALIVAAVAFALYGLLFTSPGSQSGSGDTGEEPQKYTAEPVLRLYTWENYWESDTKQARREVEMELGVTYETGKLKHITQIHQGGDKYKTSFGFNYDDNEMPYNRETGYFCAEYNGYMQAEHSSKKKVPSIYAVKSTTDALTTEYNTTMAMVSGKDFLTIVASCYSHLRLKANEYSNKTVYEDTGYTITTQFLSEVYGNVPQALKSVKRVSFTVNVTVRALDEDRSEIPVAEAVVQIRHYEPWKGAAKDDLLAAGVPLKDTSYRQEMTLIEYSQREDIAEALS